MLFAGLEVFLFEAFALHFVVVFELYQGEFDVALLLLGGFGVFGAE